MKELTTEENMQAITNGVAKAFSDALKNQSSIVDSAFYHRNIKAAVRAGVQEAFSIFLNENKTAIISAVNISQK